MGIVSRAAPEQVTVTSSWYHFEDAARHFIDAYAVTACIGFGTAGQSQRQNRGGNCGSGNRFHGGTLSFIKAQNAAPSFQGKEI
ncbi:hypothetical protein N6L27_08435 [Leisingera sp. SS27]|uniref:hypothetical protein n=1 Tax=Leisingera sp. SS27 TaxID=2979462 RepID=UPI00232DB65D|nr:hypothetical protein [Leisingera sp. SS27]MDC0658017.1 hypothetical protein [Leisingera sp. SS27]